MRLAILLVLLLLSWAGALGGAMWLGLTALADPAVIASPPRLVLRPLETGSHAADSLRSALADAGMASDGALWQLTPTRTGALDAVAIEMRAEDAGGLGRLGAALRADRLGGEPAIVLAIPDRGTLTERIALPVARRRLADHARALDVRVLEQRLRRGDGVVEMQWILERHPRGAGAPDVPLPRLEAPRLP